MNWGWRNASDENGWYLVNHWDPINNSSNYSHGQQMIIVRP
jgi:hypothetical protein